MKNNKNMFLTRIGALGAVVALLLPLPVFAHAILVKSQPAKDEVISVSPKQIDVWFNDKVGSEYKALAVIDSAGKRVDNKDVEQESGNEAHLYATLQNLEPTVRYRVVSIDTHIITGKFQFSVKAP